MQPGRDPPGSGASGLGAGHPDGADHPGHAVLRGQGERRDGGAGAGMR